MTLAARYAAIKTKVGGNREVMGYEETFGQPRDEAQRITPPNRNIVRILAEIEFAIRLSAEQEGKYDELIAKAMDILEASLKDEGVITKSACASAEEAILPMAEAAKEYKLILAGHAHIDMNWMWSWHETVAATLATFRTMLKIMDEYPEFCFSQSQTAVYKIVEDYEPSMMEKIKARIKEGRWEITSSAWVETDKNMPSTESLIRHIKNTKNYLRDVWDIDPDSLEVDFSPDTFGHSANLPEIDQNGGVKYYYHCRGLDGKNALYRWVGPSGKELMVYREQHWYNSGITPKIGITAIDIAKRSGDFKTGLIVYGVGDHGGGPTRRDVERAIEMMAWPVFPAIKFGTFAEYFHEAESVREKLPVVDHELNLLFTGCYTTQSRLKMGNRQCETAFLDAENLSAYAAMTTGAPFHGKEMEASYNDVLFTHFHDILTGSCVQDSREHSMGLYSNSLARFQNEYLNAMMSISSATDTSAIPMDEDISSSQAQGAGPGYGVDHFNGKPAAESGNGLTRIWTVFNPTTVDKEECAEITVWDWTGDMRFMKVTDADGNDLPFQVMGFRPETYWDHKFFRFMVYVKVPAMGYTTVVLRPAEINEYPFYLQNESRTQKPYRNFVLDNGLVKATFDYSTGDLVSFIDLESGKEWIKPGAHGSFIVADTEKRTSNAWNIGRYLKINTVDELTEINGGRVHGKLSNGLHFSAKYKASVITADITLEKGAKALTIKTTVDWNETYGGDTAPVLAYRVPLDAPATEYLYDIPGGTIARPAGEMDAPALTFCASPDGDKAAFIATDCKYGYRGRENGELISTLINTAGSPDKYPERGIHHITMYVGVAANDRKTLKETADSLIRKLTYVAASAHTGALPTSGNFFTFDSDNAVISAVSISDDRKSLIVRVNNVTADSAKASITLPFAVSEAIAVDYLDRPVDKCVSVCDKSVSVELGAMEICTLKITL